MGQHCYLDGICGRDHNPLCALVSSIFTQLLRSEEMMYEQNLSIDASTIWRWVQRYAPELNERIRRELKSTNGSWRTDETYVRVAGRWTYLYRAVDSTGATVDFLLSEARDLNAARSFFQKALAAPGHLDRNDAELVETGRRYAVLLQKLQAVTNR
jgi:transposase, IS6 family